MVVVRMGFSGAAAFNLELARFQDNLSDASPAFEAMADYQRGIWSKQFATEGAYGGDRWPALSPAYGKWKAKHHPGKPILELSGDLKESLTQRPFGVDAIREQSMVIGTAVPYATYHQNGNGVPVRAMVTKPSRADAKEFARILQGWIVKGRVE